MKNKLFISIVFFISCLLIGCNTYPNQKQNPGNKVTATPVPETTVAPVNEYNNIQVSTELLLDVNVISLSNHNMNISIINHNDSPIYGFTSGHDVVEKQVAGTWQELEIINDDIVTYDVLWQYRPGDSFDYCAFWNHKYGALPSGDYRLKITVTEFSEDNSKEYNYIYINFTLDTVNNG